MEDKSYHGQQTQEGIYDSFKNYQKQAIKAAKELSYPKEVIDKINKCTSIGQIAIVMTSARQVYL